MQTKVRSAAGTFYYAYTDHLGNITALSAKDGTPESGSITRYDPFGPFTMVAPTTNPSISSHGFTGHRHNNTGANDIDLIYMNARYYLPQVGRFISPDTIVPDPGNPQSYNRYSYSYNNPVNYTDPSGHCIFGLDTAVCAVVGAVGIGILKAVDYGWTAYDLWQAGRTLADQDASQADKAMAGLTISLSVLFEAIEPDDWTPIGLPADDIIRHGAQKAFEQNGPGGLEAFLRKNLGNQADTAIRKMDELLGLDPDSLYAAAIVPSGKQNFTAAGRALQKHANRSGDAWAKYLPEGVLNPANYNTWAAEHVMGILSDPGTTRRYYKDFIDNFAPDGRGLRYNVDGSFVGFLN